jgi:hypothetical protein
MLNAGAGPLPTAMCPDIYLPVCSAPEAAHLINDENVVVNGPAAVLVGDDTVIREANDDNMGAGRRRSGSAWLIRRNLHCKPTLQQ